MSANQPDQPHIVSLSCACVRAECQLYCVLFPVIKGRRHCSLVSFVVCTWGAGLGFVPLCFSALTCLCLCSTGPSWQVVPHEQYLCQCRAWLDWIILRPHSFMWKQVTRPYPAIAPLQIHFQLTVLTKSKIMTCKDESYSFVFPYCISHLSLLSLVPYSALLHCTALYGELRGTAAIGRSNLGHLAKHGSRFQCQAHMCLAGRAVFLILPLCARARSHFCLRPPFLFPLNLTPPYQSLLPTFQLECMPGQWNGTRVRREVLFEVDLHFNVICLSSRIWRAMWGSWITGVQLPQSR